MADREKFSSQELVIVMSNYELGAIRAIKEFPRGSRKAPKLLITADSGEYLLKRRARGKDDPYKVAFAHAIQLYLATVKFPLPHLIGTRKDNNSMFQHNGRVFEMFEYIRGSNYDNSLEETFDSGRTLALYHKLLRDFKTEFQPGVGSYHDARNLHSGFERLPEMLGKADREHVITERQMSSTMEFLQRAYEEAKGKVNAAGLLEWPAQIVHCDWHPGNVLFRNREVVAALDFDSARLQQRVIDLANGVLQFSILGGSEDPGSWPEYLDESRFKRFLRGYDEVDPVPAEEVQVIPWLMIEAMVAESIFPIAATGFFGRIDGYGFLAMIERKIRWIQKNHVKLLGRVAG